MVPKIYEYIRVAVDDADNLCQTTYEITVLWELYFQFYVV